MAVRKWANLKFNTNKGKVETLKISDVKESVTPDEIKTAMTQIVEADVFEHQSRGRLISLNDADIVTQEEKELTLQ